MEQTSIYQGKTPATPSIGYMRHAARHPPVTVGAPPHRPVWLTLLRLVCPRLFLPLIPIMSTP